MLVQSSRRELPEHDAFVDRTLLRHERFCVAVIRASNLALDYGVLMQAVRYMTRFRRAQLMVLLAGRGYFRSAKRLSSLGPGDVVESDQLLQEAEGYAGSPCELLIVEWDDGSELGPAHRGEARFSRIGPAEIARLRAHVQALHATPAETWVAELARQLRACGRPRGPVDARALAPPSEDLANAYAALGVAASRLEGQRSLTEVASVLGVCERQVHRRLGDLAREFGHPFEGWREFVHENRIEWAIQLLSQGTLPLERVARLAGYRSAVALCHAFSLRGAPTPGSIATTLAEHWG
jgi:AraC-like DNA-binding protein